MLADYTPYVYATNDYGKTWKRIADGTNGIPAGHPTRVVREDPDLPDLLVAGTEYGMYIVVSTTARTGSRSSSTCRRADHGSRSSIVTI